MSILNNCKETEKINIEELLEDYKIDDSLMTEASDKLLDLN